MIFPLILATFFHVSLIEVYDKDIVYSAIPVAVVEKQENKNFRQVVDSISEGDDAFFTTTYTDEDEALEMLGNGGRYNR